MCSIVSITDILVKKEKKSKEKLQEYETPIFLTYVHIMLLEECTSKLCTTNTLQKASIYVCCGYVYIHLCAHMCGFFSY